MPLLAEGAVVRWSQLITILTAFVSAFPVIAQPDPVSLERYLAARSLRSLEFESLIERIPRTPEAEREELINRAARVLSELLETETNPDRQREWNERAKELLRRTDGPAAADLEIRILRAAYQRAEGVAERWRLRDATDSEVAAAVRTLADAAPRLERIARQAEQRADLIDRRLAGATGDLRDRMREDAMSARATLSQARYLAGWCRLYLAQLRDSDEEARDALASFAWILGSPGEPEPALDEVDPTNIQLDHVARSALGVAACYATLDDAASARDWLLTVSAHAPDGLADVVDAWRMVIAAEVGRWNELIASLDADPTPTAARLIAVGAIEAIRSGPARNSDARGALEHALAAMIDMGDAASVVDLSRRYGALPVPGRGFLARYAEGVGMYLDAESRFRNSGAPSDRPAPEGADRANFASAVRALQRAVEVDDASRFGAAVADARAVLGAALFYAAGHEGVPDALVRASDQLVAAADALSDSERRAGALWLAARATRLHAEQTSGDAALEAARVADEIAARFLREFPQHDLAGAILYEMAMREGLDARRRAELLRRVPPTSSAYPAALDQAARALYEVFRSAPADGRTPAALRYIDAAEPLLADDLAAAADPEISARALARARRLLDALLSTSPPDSERARSVLARAETLPGTADPDAALELAYRRAQIALIDGGDEAARAAMSQIEGLADERAITYAQALRRFVFRRAVAQHQSVRDANAGADVIATGARRVADAGRAVLTHSPDFSDPAVLTAALYLADALDDLATFDADEPARTEALDLRMEVLDMRPADADLLADVARSAELVGRDPVARDAWNRRLALLPVGTDEWFETRYRQLRHLATVDPDEARDVLRRQHRVLYPDYGPDPWGDRLRELDDSLGDER